MSDADVDTGVTPIIIPPMITVLYTCDACGLKDRGVLVPERDPDEDVVHFVRDIVGGCINDDHRDVSPKCRAQKITMVKIPVDTANKIAAIGQKVVHKPVDDGR